MIYLLNKSHIPNNPLREDILEAANDYIGKVYAYDRGPDYLAIDRYNLKVCLTNEIFPVVPYHDWVYYNAISIVQSVANSLQLEPDQLAIDAITLDFFPIERLENFRKTAKEAITEFVKERGIVSEAVIVFPIDTFDVDVIVPDEIENIDETAITLDESFDEMDSVEIIELPLKDFVRMRGDKIVLNEFKLLKVALDNFFEN
jgi:hypothetical protein